MMLLFLLFINIVYSLPIATSCSNQLKTFYVGQGLPVLTPTELPFNFTTGISLGVPFVTIGINVQQVAIDYGTIIGQSPLPNNSYVSLDIPYCYSDITFSCVDRIIYGITKTGNCTMLLDRDTSLGNPIAGRLFIYPNPLAPCNGNALITFFNTTLTPPSITSNYSYDIEGIFTGVLSTETEAIFDYRNANCPYSDGNIADIGLTTQFVCLASQLQCASPRPINTDIITPVNLTYEYRCLGTVPGTGNTNSVVRVINHNSSIGGIETEFDLEFISTLTGNPLFTTYPRQLIMPQTIRQFLVGTTFTNYDIAGTYGGYNFTIEPISLFPIPDQYISQVPCVCNLTLFCDSFGNADFSSTGTMYFINNIFPVAIANTTTPFVREGDTATMNDNGSFDPDMSPDVNLTYQWIEGAATENINVTIDNPTDQFNVTFVTFPYMIGIYNMLFIVGDGQDVNASVVNISAVSEIPFCDSAGGSQIFGEVNETIYLNASTSVDALNVTLVGFWSQISGFPVDIDNNESLIANFTPYISGTYIFQVNLTNGLANCTYQLLVQVNPPTFSPIDDPNGTLPPWEIPPNRTVPPIDINQTDIPFVSDPPVLYPLPNATVSPVSVGPVPFFPVFPPDNTKWHTFLFWILFALFLGLWLLLLMWVIMEKSDDESRLVVPNKYISIKYS